MSDANLYRIVMQRAAYLLGGADAVGQRLRVPPQLVRKWMEEGRYAPEIFLYVCDLLAESTKGPRQVAGVELTSIQQKLADVSASERARTVRLLAAAAGIRSRTIRLCAEAQAARARSLLLREALRADRASRAAAPV